MDYRRFLPNLCTSMNLVFGMCSILSTYHGDLIWGSIFILLALVADGLDGRTARFFGVSSEMGKEMDSLCNRTFLWRVQRNGQGNGFAL